MGTEKKKAVKTPENLGSLTIEAIVDVALVATAADGDIDEDELMVMAGLLIDMPGFEGVTEEDLIRLIETQGQRLDNYKGSADELLAEMAKKVGPRFEDRAAAFTVALVVSATDGEIKEGEEEYLGQLASALDLDEDSIAKLIAELEETSEESANSEKASSKAKRMSKK